MKKILILIFYFSHFFLMLAGLAFALMYFTSNGELLLEGLSVADKNVMLSYRRWHIVVGAVYPVFMLYGIHLLYKQKFNAVYLYSVGCAIYVITNIASYVYALTLKIESAASLEDLWFSLAFIFITGLVYFLSRSQALQANA